jgi:hypothetical protein
LAVPRGRLVFLPVAAPVDIGEDHEAVGVLRPKKLFVFFKPFAKLAIETNRDGDVLVVHQPDILGQRLGRLAKLASAMNVNIDGGELRPRGAMLGEDQHRTRLELVERKSGRLLLGLKRSLTQRRKGAKKKKGKDEKRHVA